MHAAIGGCESKPTSDRINLVLRSLKSERGNALIVVLVVVVLLGLLTAGAFAILRKNYEVGSVNLALKGQTLKVAESGITESLSWFRQQPRQPVREFHGDVFQGSGKPIPDALVREFEVSRAARVWGRYEVLPENVVDVTAARGRGPEGSGTVWEVTSVGHLFVRNHPKRRYDEPPNEPLHTLAVSTELQRLAIRPPARGALMVERADAVEIGDGGRIRGTNGAAVIYRAGTGAPVVGENAEVSSESGAAVRPAPQGEPLPPYDLGEVAVLGVRPQELKDLADIAVDTIDDLPEQLPQLAIVYIDSDATFTEARPLAGGGVLYVNGDLTLAPQSNSSFFGAVYVAGDLIVEAPAQLSGTVIARGGVRIRGRGDISELTYNEDILTVVRRSLGQYRIRRSLTRVYKVAKGDDA